MGAILTEVFMPKNTGIKVPDNYEPIKTNLSDSMTQ